MSKGILGIGDSFMWGESLYFYADLPNLPFSKEHNFDFESMTEGMVAYKNKYRFIQLVADHFDTWCTVKSLNGSTNEFNIEFLNEFVDKDVIQPDYGRHYLFKLDINEYKLVIFIFTSHIRSERNNEEIISESLKSADIVFSKFEEKGIKVLTLCWMPEFFNHPLYKELYVNKNRHTPLYFNDIQYDWYENLVQNDSLKLTIKSDFYNKGLQKNDIHFNKKGNEMMCNSIIKKLTEENFCFKNE